MSSANAELVRRLFTEWGTESWREIWAPDAVFDTTRSATPNPTVARGHEAIRRFFADWIGMFSDAQVELVELLDVDDRVMTTFRWRGLGRTSGVEVEGEYFGVYELEDGRITSFWQVDSRAEALALARAAV